MAIFLVGTISVMIPFLELGPFLLSLIFAMESFLHDSTVSAFYKLFLSFLIVRNQDHGYISSLVSFIQSSIPFHPAFVRIPSSISAFYL